ncbi:hypothetical protein K0C01_12120 [Salinarchaeum sp. IM2453]|uniref:hypothetical protein n=1 Tax=Salinarchaeum sp. IM2453 TaxID=2862870 RepID=UPI001C837355|nr:hypothetical protein [Salinarchaeum sp. IM2453]QZA88509.1 hypothetical protein K0C01_12120 [Salinarchaeum sp. IM2453]
MKRRRILLLLGGTSAGAFTLGSGAFSSTTAERDVRIEVVSDEQAFVGYDVQGENDSDETLPKIVLDEGESEPLVNVTNRFTEEITITDATIKSDLDITLERDKDSIDGGETATIDGTCNNSKGEDTVELDITLEGDRVSADLSGANNQRRFVVQCGTEPATPEFSGNGNVFRGQGSGILSVRVLYDDDKESEQFEWDTNSNSQIKKANTDLSGTISAVYFVNWNVVYYNPNMDKNEIDFPDNWPDNRRPGDKKGGESSNSSSGS